MSEIKIYNIDCMELMRNTPDGFYDLAIVDPEYRDINQPDQFMRKSGSMKDWKGAPKGDYFDELFRVSKEQIIFGGNYFTEFLEPNNNWFIWYKLNDGVHMSMAEMAWVSIRKNIKVFDFRPMGHNVNWHPTAKPVKLYEYLLKTYANNGDKILDTHFGSGSHGIAIHNMNSNTQHEYNFSLTATEINKEYFDLSVKRLSDVQKQLKCV